MQGKKLLIVDDEADIRILLKEYLELEGYQVLVAANAKEAEKALAKEPDLILLDINMPGTDGLLWCEQIRNFLQIPILFLSARTEEEDKIKGFKAGGDDYILKPFSMEELSARIEAHLRREERKEQGKTEREGEQEREKRRGEVREKKGKREMQKEGRRESESEALQNQIYPRNQTTNSILRY